MAFTYLHFTSTPDFEAAPGTKKNNQNTIATYFPLTALGIYNADHGY